MFNAYCILVLPLFIKIFFINPQKRVMYLATFIIIRGELVLLSYFLLLHLIRKKLGLGTGQNALLCGTLWWLTVLPGCTAACFSVMYIVE